MASSVDEKLDKILEKLDRLAEEQAELRGAKLVERMEAVEQYQDADRLRWGKMAGLATAAGTAAAYLVKKVGI